MKRIALIVLSSWGIYLFSWLFVYSTGINSFSQQSEDTLPAVFLPIVILRDRTLFFDSVYNMVIEKYPHPDDKDYSLGLTPFYFKRVHDRYISSFPLLPGLIAVPVYLLPVVSGMEITWSNVIFLSHMSAGLIQALAGGVFFLLVKRHFKLSEKKSLLLTFVYSFCTVNYASVSQTLWQHGPLQFFTILSLYYLFSRRMFLSGVMYGLAITARLTAIFYLPFYILLVLYNNLHEVSGKKISLACLLKDSRLYIWPLGILIPTLFYYMYTEYLYFGVENSGYAGQYLTGWLSRFPEGFLGMWISPSKGLLLYSPVFVFIFYPLYKMLKDGKAGFEHNYPYLIFFCIVIWHTLILGRWKHWYGGWSFGYRMASDILPFLCLLLIPFLRGAKRDFLTKLFTWLVICSLLVQLSGLVFFDGVWHAAYDRGYVDTSWLWSVKDSEPIFNLRRILVKLGYLQQACPACLKN